MPPVYVSCNPRCMRKYLRNTSIGLICGNSSQRSRTNLDVSMPSGWLKTMSARMPLACARTFTTGTLADSMISSQLISPSASKRLANIFIAFGAASGTSSTAMSTSPFGKDKPVEYEPNTFTWQSDQRARQVLAIVFTQRFRALSSAAVWLMNFTKSSNSSCNRRTVFSRWGRSTNHGGRHGASPFSGTSGRQEEDEPPPPAVESDMNSSGAADSGPASRSRRRRWSISRI
mmetsp:Transcript_100414/g.290037  ORF Transcript_100414/g.290037 Transcript_100414/m.290037 type:complete len:231 (-) Transcript_100414:202-894(-)